ncbi:MAG: hypothetical protein IJQ61_08055 [Bacteroidales bacterium]|nr:hypothetical protein [Bacteroidales bacterium]
MKKVYLMALALVFATCTKEVKSTLPDVDYEGFTVLEARIESLLIGEGDGRTWEEGAAIGVFGSEKGYNEKYLLRSADASLSEALFYGPRVSGKEISAYFPYQSSASGAAEALTLVLASNQTYDESAGAKEFFLRYCPTAYAFLEGNALNFQYPFGLLEVKIALEETLFVNEITCSSASVPVSGIAAIDRRGYAFTPGAGEQLSLSFSEAVSSRMEDGSVRSFYLVLAPGEYTDLTLSIGIEGEQNPILIAPSLLSVPRISAVDFSLASVFVGTGGPEGFDPENVHFDE